MPVDEQTLAERIEDLFDESILTKASIGLANVDNTNDLDKPISTATQLALNNKVDTTTTVNGLALNSNIVLNSDHIVGTATSITTSTALTTWSTLYTANASSGNLTLTLPVVAATNTGQFITIVKTDSSSNTIQINAAAGNTLRASSSVLSTQNSGLVIQSDGLTTCNVVATNSSESSGSGSGGSTFSTSVGVGTTTPQASLEIAKWTKQSTGLPIAPEFGVVSCPCDEFGYPQYLEYLSPTSLAVRGPLQVVLGGNTVTINTDTILTGLSANNPVDYVYVDNTANPANPIVGVSSIAPEIYSSPRYTQSACYLAFNNSFYDVCENLWYSRLTTGTFNFDANIKRFGTHSWRNDNGLYIVCTPSEMNSARLEYDPTPRFSLINNATWMADIWIYPTGTINNNATLFWLNATAFNSGTAGVRCYITSTNQVVFSVGYTTGTTSSQNVGSPLVTNSWNYIGVQQIKTYNVSLNFNVNGSTAQLFNTIPPTNFSGTAISVFHCIGSVGATTYIDEFIVTPYIRPWQATSVFDPLSARISTRGCSFASYYNGSDPYNDAYGFPWYVTTLKNGPTPRLGIPTLQIGNNQFICWTPFAPNFSILNEWTIELWIYSFSAISANNTVMDFSGQTQPFATSTSPATPAAYRLILTSGTSDTLPNYRLFLSTTGTTWNIFNGNTFSLIGNSWNHIAITYSTAGVYTCFLNGASILTSAAGQANVPFCSTVSLGGGFSTTFGPHSVYLSEFRMTPFRVYTSNFTVPSTLLGVNCSRDMFDTNTNQWSIQGLGAANNISRTYIGCVIMQGSANNNTRTGSVRHYTGKQTLDPSIKSGACSLLRDGTLITPQKTWSFQMDTTHPYGSFGIAMSVFLRGDGKLAIGGTNASDFANSLGVTLPVNATTDYYQIIPTPHQVKFKLFTVGNQLVLAVDTNNTVWAVGRNVAGCLGTGNTNNVTCIQPVYYGTNITQIAAPNTPPPDTSNQSTYILDNGDLWVCGTNSSGQLGLGNTTNVLVWTRVNRIGGIAWAGFYATRSQLWAWHETSGNLYACGVNSGGELGINSQASPISTLTACVMYNGAQMTRVTKLVLQQWTGHFLAALTMDSNIYTIGSISVLENANVAATNNGTFQGPFYSGIIDIAAGRGYTFIYIKRDRIRRNQNSPFRRLTTDATNGAHLDLISIDQIYPSLIKKMYSKGAINDIVVGLLSHEGKLLVSSNNQQSNFPLTSSPAQAPVEVLVGEPIEDFDYVIVGSGANPNAAGYVLTSSGNVYAIGSGPLIQTTKNTANNYAFDWYKLILPSI